MKSSVTSEQPNIILILCDDLGYGDLGCYGSTVNKTPVLDRLAEEGIRFTDFYAASPVCSPSRAAIMTGCYPQRVNLGEGESFCVLLPNDPIGLHPEEVTIPKLLKLKDYTTKIIGKWHLGDQPPFLPIHNGFDSYFGLPYSNDMRSISPKFDKYIFPPLPLIQDHGVIELEPDQESLTERYTAEAIDFIHQNKDKPFFLYLSHMYVHWPYYPPKSFLDKSDNGEYGAEVEHLDWCTGLILEALQACEIAENTLVIFTSDNGAGDQGTNFPLRGAKGQTWEGGMRVPCIMKWPKHIHSNRICSEIVTSMDILPTISGITHSSLPEEHNTDGRNILPILKDASALTPHDAFYYYKENTLEAVRQGRWKYHLKTNELYDLRHDVGERNNVADEYPDKLLAFRNLAELCIEQLGDKGQGIVGKGCRPCGRVENVSVLANQFFLHESKEYD